MRKVQPYQMPDPLEISGLVQTLRSNAVRGRGLLSGDRLQALLDQTLASGMDIAELLAVDDKQTRPADLDEDDAFGGTAEMIAGAVRVLTSRGPTPLTPDQELCAKRAAQLQQYWIGDSLRFLSLKFTAEWRECNDRLSRLDKPMSEGLETPRQALSALGLAWALARIEAVHATYGRVLGFAGLNDEAAKKLAIWEKNLNTFLSGLAFHHSDDPDIHALFFTPYEAAIEEGRARRRQANTKRAAASNPTP